MLYLVAAEGDTLDSRISRRFGHSPFHLLVNPDTMEIQAVNGDVDELPRHGLGRFSEQDIAGVISGNMGPHAFDDITAMGWKVYITRGTTVREALERVKRGEITPSDRPTMKHSVHDHEHHYGAGDRHNHEGGFGHGPGDGSGRGGGGGFARGGGRGRGRFGGGRG